MNTDVHWFQIAFNSAWHEATETTLANFFFGRQLNHLLELRWKLERRSAVLRGPDQIRNEWKTAVTNLKLARQRSTIEIAFPILLIRVIGSRKAKSATVGQYVAKETYKLLPLWSKPCGIEVFTWSRSSLSTLGQDASCARHTLAS